MKSQKIRKKHQIQENLLYHNKYEDKDLYNTNSRMKQQITELTKELNKTGKELKNQKKKCRKLENKLQESKEIADIFLNTCDEVFVLMKIDGTVVQVNQFLMDRIKTTVKNLIGKNIYQWFPPKLAKNRKKYADKVIKSGKPVHFQDYSNGRWYDNVLYPVCDVHGKVVRIAIHARDITERVQIQEKYKKTQEELKVIFDSVRAMIWSKDLKGRYLHVNHAFCEFAGLKNEKVKGKTDFDIYPDNIEIAEQYHKYDYKVLKNRKPELNIIENYLKPSGDLGWCLTDKFPYFDINGKLIGTIGFAIDITELKKAEDELQKTHRLESLGILAGGIAHDFNNLLSGIFGYIDLAREEAVPNTPIDTYLKNALSIFARAKDLTRQLLTFSKGELPVKKVIGIGHLLRDAANMVMSGSNIECDFIINRELHCVEADEGQLYQVFHNILLNARQAMPVGGTITIEAENIRLKKNQFNDLNMGEYITVSISDQGLGIPEQHIVKIFDPFFTSKQHGSGLGLAISYSIIKKHGGYITVDSRLGKGTTMNILLPATKKQKDIHHKTITNVVKREAKILLMDDEEFIRDITSQMLKRRGFRVDCAKNGEQAIALFKQAMAGGKSYDFVILDLTVQGGMGGEKTMRQLLKLDPQVKGVVSSGYSENPVLTNPQDYGFFTSLTKPVKIDKLEQVINKILEH